MTLPSQRFSVPAQDCDFTDATHLLATVRGRRFVDTAAIAGRPCTYYVTALDRLSAESEPTRFPVA